FITTDECAKDPCGNKIFCLPGLSQITIQAKAATLSLDETEWPQAKLFNGVSYNGLADAAGNSFDGNDGTATGKGDGKACGDGKSKGGCTNGYKNDDYVWTYQTTDKIDTTIPKIITLLPAPGIDAGSIDIKAPLQMIFEKSLLSSSINSSSILLKSFPVQPSLWFYLGKTEELKDGTKPFDAINNPFDHSIVSLYHATFLPASIQQGQDYWPVLTHGIKGINQFCMFPASGPSCNITSDNPNHFCCNGVIQNQASDCKTTSGDFVNK
ncbi:MAG: hypothetical protein AAB664_03095, partial [Patescibacteria group bacterium]